MLRTKYEEIIKKDKRRVKKKTRFSPELKYMVFKLIDNDQPPPVREIVRIVNQSKVDSRALSERTIVPIRLYTQLPTINEDEKKRIDKIIQKELSELGPRPKKMSAF